MSERRETRRRLREQRRMREALLLDLGALVYELHRQGRRAPELLQQKAAELTVVDDEVRELEAALDGAAIEAWTDNPEPEAAEPATEESEAVDLEEELAGEEPVEAGDEPEDDEPEEEPALAEHEEPRA